MVATVEFEPQDHAYLDPKIKTKWLKALRSRKFKQGHTFLKNHNNEYCCLGVLCDVIGLPIKQDQSLIKEKDAAKIFHCSKSTANNLQTELANFNDGYRFNEDTGMNQDVKPQKFYQIARWIERNL